MGCHFGILFITCCFLLIGPSHADWWDNFVDGVHEKVIQAADWIRDKAGPTIRDKFDGAKKTLQDPETHEKVQDWVQDEALPVVKEKFEQFKTFINEDVMPEVQKIVEAGKEANTKRKNNNDNDESVVKLNED